MPNPIKYTAGTETLALKKGNFYIGTGDVGKGPSDTTGYYQGPNVPSGGYVIYLNKEGAPGGLSYHSAANDAQLIAFTNNLAGQSYTTVNECLVYFASQTDKVVLNRDYEGIVTDGLVLNLDAGFTPSYPRSGTTWSDVSLSGNNGTLTNGPTFNSDNGGSIVFDGSNDYVIVSNLTSYNGNQGTLCSWVYPNSGNNNDYVIALGEVGQTGKSRAIGTYSNRWWLVGYGSSNEDWLTNFTTTANQWAYVTYTWDNTTNIGISVNGVFDSTTRSGLNPVAGTQLRVGAPAWTNLGTYGFWNGRIPVAQVYNRALSADEILQNYNAQKGRFGL
jgi:hypothetical protein